MGLRSVIIEGDEVLRMKAREVTAINDRLLTLIDDLWETLDHYEGIGLAAPQVGVLRRVAVIDTGNEGERMEIINPKRLSESGETTEREGCLSIPGITGCVTRPERVVVEAEDRTGMKRTISAEGLLAKALCHEMDHLDGVLFIDKAFDIQDVPDEEDEDGADAFDDRAAKAKR